MANKNYLDYEGLSYFFEKLEERYAPIQALQFRGTVATISALPTVADERPGYVYNVTTGGTTTADFVEGAGQVLQNGENVVVVNIGTDENPELKFDTLGGLFNIEDRLQFGNALPETELENGRTFLYMGPTTYTYEAVTPTGDEVPSDEGWYEYDSTTETYTVSSDSSVDASKTYYIRTGEDKVHGVIYVYNGTTSEWVAQSSGDVMVPITNSQIDALFE